jgi:DNA-binding MarR family transcriptional regulator
MHRTYFVIKRAHLTFMRYGRAILRIHEPLTPARLDLLSAVDQESGGHIPQGSLTRNLGLHHSTVSKMLTRLAELDLVRRTVNERDQRVRLVSLTARGRALLREAQTGNASDGMAELLVDSAIAPHRHGLPAGAEVRRTNGVLRRYSAILGDTAIALYPPPLPVAIAASRTILWQATGGVGP